MSQTCIWLSGDTLVFHDCQTTWKMTLQDVNTVCWFLYANVFWEKDFSKTLTASYCLLLLKDVNTRESEHILTILYVLSLDYCYYFFNSFSLPASHETALFIFLETACPHPWIMWRHLVRETVNPLMSLLGRDSADMTETDRALKQMARRQWCKACTESPD